MYLDRLELGMGSEVGYGLRKLLAAEDMGYMLGVCLWNQYNTLMFQLILQHYHSSIGVNVDCEMCSRSTTYSKRWK